MNPLEIPVLMYHDVGAVNTPWSVSPEAFAVQMEYLAREGYRTISLEELQKEVDSPQETSEKRVVITFDDARQGVYQQAWPVLKKYGFTATLFVVPQWIEGRGIPPEEAYSYFLTWDRLRELRDAGFSLGSHSFSHPNLAVLSPEMVLKELEQAENLLFQRLGLRPLHFAYPYGKCTPEVVQEVQRRYLTAVTTQPGFSKVPGKYARQGIMRETSLDHFKKLLSRPRLSICMIVKNEEEHLPHCLASVQGLGDELIVVDTGSSDRTKEIAQKFGARIFDFPWNQDFAAARNESLRQATGDWILILDADEVLGKEEHPLILEAINRWEIGGYRILTRNYSNDSGIMGWEPGVDPLGRGYSGWYPSLKVRLFPRRVEVGFQGRVHEIIPPSLLGKVAVLPLVVHHYGVRPGKVQRNLELTEQKVVEQPDAQAFWELGVQYKELGRYLEAEGALRQSLRLQPEAGLPVLNLAVVCQKQGKIDEAVALYHQVLEQKNYPEAHFGLGYCHFRKNDLEKSQHHFQEALRGNPRHVEAWVNLAAVYERQKKYAEALATLERALFLVPDHPRAYYNRGVVWEKAGKLEPAVESYRKAAEFGYKKEEALLRARKIEEFLGK